MNLVTHNPAPKNILLLKNIFDARIPKKNIEKAKF